MSAPIKSIAVNGMNFWHAPCWTGGATALLPPVMETKMTDRPMFRTLSCICATLLTSVVLVSASLSAAV